MIDFVLNNENISTGLSPGILLLDYIRKNRGLTGTKESCREGDCGACLVLIGEFEDNNLLYHPVNSCLLPLGEVNGKHVVTIEGINTNNLNPIQRVFIDEGAVQCGYCTPGFIISLTAFFLNSKVLKTEGAVSYVDGNICRCTGYVSVVRAAEKLCRDFDYLFEKSSLLGNGIDRIKLLVNLKILPEYFRGIPNRLQKLSVNKKENGDNINRAPVIVAGGTDLFVEKPDELLNDNLVFLSNRKELRNIWIEEDRCYIGSMSTVEDISSSEIINKVFPEIKKFFKLISSTPIRYKATLGGNIINASPIGDLTIFFLALDASVILSSNGNRRELLLKDLFKGYKQLDKKENEILENLSFKIPDESSMFNFEKVSQRKHLDIASVNSAIFLKVEGGSIKIAHLSAGGVSPIPVYLLKTSEYLIGKKISSDELKEASRIAQTEISPISDVRGSADYKRLLLRQLFYSHFVTLFPKEIKVEDLL